MASDAGNLDIALVGGLVGGIYYFFNLPNWQKSKRFLMISSNN